MSELEIRFSSDGLQAMVDVRTSIFEAIPANRLPEFIRTRLLEHGVVETAIWHENINAIALQLLELGPNRMLKEMVAAGIPARNGKDSRLVFQVPINTRERNDSSGRPYVQVVAARSLVCRLLRPTQGTDGENVFGEPIPARPGELSEQPRFDPEDFEIEENELAIEYRARRRGWVQYLDQQLSLPRELVIPRTIGLETGNIEASGNLEIQGNISSGYLVQTDGDIQISGDVERNARIRGRDIKVDGVCHGWIQAYNNFIARVLEYTQVHVGNLASVDAVFASRIYASSILADSVKASFLQASRLIQVEQIKHTTGHPSTLMIMPHFNVLATINDFAAELASDFLEIAAAGESLAQLKNHLQTQSPLRNSLDDSYQRLQRTREQLEQTQEQGLASLHQRIEQVQPVFDQTDGQIRCRDLARESRIRMYGQQRDILVDTRNMTFFFDDTQHSIRGDLRENRSD